MSIVTKEQLKQLIENGIRQRNDDEAYDAPAQKYFPVVHFFLPLTAGQWLLISVNPDDTDLAFGLCQVEEGYSALGYVRLSELESLGSPLDKFTDKDGNPVKSGLIQSDDFKRAGEIDITQWARVAGEEGGVYGAFKKLVKFDDDE